jgi:signal transduction histidine kinase
VTDEELIAAVAHEVKTPFAIVRGFAELLAKAPDSEVQREAPTAILDAAERLGPLLDDLLLAVEVQSGLERRDVVNLGGLVADALEPLHVSGDIDLIQRLFQLVAPRPARISVAAANGVVTLVGASEPNSKVELYLARAIAEAHGGELREDADGLRLTLPLA